MEMKQLKRKNETKLTPVKESFFLLLYAVLSGKILTRNLKGTAKRQQAQEQEIKGRSRSCSQEVQKAPHHFLFLRTNKHSSCDYGFEMLGEGVMARLFPTLEPLQPFRG